MPCKEQKLIVVHSGVNDTQSQLVQACPQFILTADSGGDEALANYYLYVLPIISHIMYSVRNHSVAIKMYPRSLKSWI